jgi:hypothetical protein
MAEIFLARDEGFRAGNLAEKNLRRSAVVTVFHPPCALSGSLPFVSFRNARRSETSRR